MPDVDEPRFPTLDEFWTRLAERDVEPDLRASLEDRIHRQQEQVERLPAALVTAVAARLLPGAVPPEALAVFVDRNYDRQLGRADDKAGLAPRAELIPAGFAALDAAARTHHGEGFADLGPEKQDALLAAAERGEPGEPGEPGQPGQPRELEGGAGFDSATWFKRLRGLLLLAYGSDPRGMVEMGFPGPSYRTGHVWLDEGEVAARAQRRRGYRVL